MPLSNNQIDRLGDRLRDRVRPEDRELYFDWREEFVTALDEVQSRVESALPRLGAVPRRKTLDSTTAKLVRETIRLSQVQDIAGCRIVVEDLDRQNDAVERLLREFDEARVEDLRHAPHHRYRAVHVIVRATNGRVVEVQVRTVLQDVWAQLSEKLADRFGIEVKYGQGPHAVHSALDYMSEVGWAVDSGGDTAFDAQSVRAFAQSMAQMQILEEDD